MSRRSVELAFEHGAARKAPYVPNPVEAALDDLERQITRDREKPKPALLSDVVDRVSALTGADGAAIAVRDQGDVVCKASVGDAPEVGARLQPDSALTRQCFETGTVVVCDDTETDYRVRSATVKSLHLRSAVVVPIQVPAALGIVEVLGLIEVLSSRPYAFNLAHVDGLKRIAELLAPVLTPVQPQESGESIPAIITMPFPAEAPASQLPAFSEESQFDKLRSDGPKSEEPKSKTPVFEVIGVVLLLTLLLIVSAFLFRKPVRNASTPVPSPASPSAEPTPPKQQDTPSAVEGTTSVPKSSSSSISAPPPASSPGTAAKSAEAPQQVPSLAKSDVAKDRELSEIRPTVPALVVRGIPPGSEIFVDDRLLPSTGRSGISQSGETSISTLPEGQHRLRLRSDGYRDLDQGFDVLAGKTATITAKLEPLLPPPGESAKPPILAVTPAVKPALTAAVTPTAPPPVRLTRPSLPDFVLDRTLKAHSGWVTGVAFSPDGQRLASGSWDRTLKFWQVGSGEQLNSVVSQMKEVQSLAFSRDGHWLATENSSNTVTLRNPTTGQEILALPSDKPLGPLGSNWVYSISFSPDGRWLASGIDDKTVRLWDVRTGHKIRDLTGLRRPVIYIAFSPDGQLLATGDDSKTIRIWDVRSGEQIYKLSGHKKEIYAVAFSPNGRRLASASADKTVKLWDLTTGREVHTLTGHGNVVTSLAFSPDGRWLISGSWDKTVKIWDVETGRELRTLTGHDHPIYSVAFDSRGRWLASGSEDGTIKLWRLSDATDQSKLQQ